MEAISDDERYMGLALDQARCAGERDEVPIGAVVVQGGRVLGRGHNLVETLSDPTAHAEMQALTAACSAVGGKYLPQATLYVTVEPCAMCAGAIGWAQVGRVVYGAADEKRGYSVVGTPRMLHPKTEVVSGIRAQECGALVADFFAQKRKKS